MIDRLDRLYETAKSRRTFAAQMAEKEGQDVEDVLYWRWRQTRLDRLVDFIGDRIIRLLGAPSPAVN